MHCTGTRLIEGKLPDLMLALHDEYGAATTRPKGLIIEFKMTDPHCTYQNCSQKIEKIIADNGLVAEINIRPGPEMKVASRMVIVRVGRDLLLPGFTR